MSRVIWKYELLVEDEQKLLVPRDGRVLCVQVQEGAPCLWVISEGGEPSRELLVHTVGTGNPVPADIGRYVSTYQLIGGALVFHVFVSNEAES